MAKSDILTISTGGSEVLASGTVINYKDEPLYFVFGEGLGKMTVRFVFEDTEATGNKPHVSSVADPDHNSITLSFINFNDPLGNGNKKPVHLGNYGGKELYLSYRIYTMKRDASKTVHYTWYVR